MLLAAGSIYLALGDRGEALFLLGFVFVVIGITLAQERKTQRALESLRDLSAPRALVIRDGQEQRIAGREVVRGDLLVLHEGDRIAADALLIDGQLEVDESLLTGEAVPVAKLPLAQDSQNAQASASAGAPAARAGAPQARPAPPQGAAQHTKWQAWGPSTPAPWSRAAWRWRRCAPPPPTRPWGALAPTLPLR